MNDQINRYFDTILDHLPRVLSAAAVLIIGFIIALIIAKVVRGLLRKTNLDNRLAKAVAGSENATTPKVENFIAQVVFYLLLLAAFVAFFSTLGIPQVTEPLQGFLKDVFSYLPRIIGAVILTIIAFFVASIARTASKRALEASGFDEKVKQKAMAVNDAAHQNMEDEALTQKAEATANKIQSYSLSDSVSSIIYYLILLLFLPAILGALNLEGLLSPVQGLVNGFLAFLPNLFGAVVILAVGYFVARILRAIVTSFARSLGLDALGQRVGLSNVGGQSLSSLAGILVYALVLLPIIVAALSALGLDTITAPASDMLQQFLRFIPSLIAAFLVLLLSFIIGKVVSEIVSKILAGLGFDTILQRLGLMQAQSKVDASSTTPSNAVGTIALVYIMVFAAIQAAALLGFNNLNELLTNFVALSGNVFLGLAVFAAGLFLSSFVYNTIKNSNVNSANILAAAARVAIIVLSGAMALGQMGLATNIVNLAFGITLGAIGIAVAIAFGIGGRDVAKGLLEDAVGSLKSGSGTQPPKQV